MFKFITITNKIIWLIKAQSLNKYKCAKSSGINGCYNLPKDDLICHWQTSKLIMFIINYYAFAPIRGLKRPILDTACVSLSAYCFQFFTSAPRRYEMHSHRI